MKSRIISTLKSLGRLALLFLLLIYCSEKKNDVIVNEEVKTNNRSDFVSFESDYNFLKNYNPDIVLLNSNNSLLAVSPSLQGRVMTSSADGMQGYSFGWINRKHFESGEINPQINVFGGEERFWIGPEGGQFGIFFKEGTLFTYDNWITPKIIDLEPFGIIANTADKISLKKQASLTNYSGHKFDFEIKRTISLVYDEELLSALNLDNLDGVKRVGYKTKNELKNIGCQTWNKKEGLLSIWLLSMLKHSETTTIVIPYNQVNEVEQRAIVNDDYFGKVPSDRLLTTEKAIFFKGDGKNRGKIGLNQKHAKDIFGSFDSENNILTIIKYNKPEGKRDYVNSKWEIQENPFDGDVINSYNDGPAEPGAKPLGPFYELESSSPAAALAPGESILHIQYTFHFQGNKDALDMISQVTLGISLKEIESAFQ